MFRAPLNRFILRLILLSALSLATHDPVSATDNHPKPVTDEVLRSLHLDRGYHKCIAVADGDTLTLERLGIVRFIGLDTPEKNHPKLPVQFMARESGAFTEKLCLGKNIRLEYDPYDENKRGNYGRVLAYLYLEDGTFVQEQLLRNGYAVAYTKYPFDTKKKDQFLAWEQTAQQEGMGFWKNRGINEVLWILRQKPLLIQVEKVSSNSHRLRIGNWSSKTFHKDEIGLNLVQLYAAAHELSPRDLRKQLMRSGYNKKATLSPTTDMVSVIGMAQKKWGIIYENHIKPRVSVAELNTQILELSNWIKQLDTELLDVVLSVNGYHPVPEKLIQAVNRPEIAEAFLKTEQIETSDGRSISWELAGKHIGKRVTVQGTIVRSFNSGTACFLNFHRNFTRYMSLVIFENSFRKFPFQPERFYHDKTVRVRGKIKMYKGRPEIVLESPKQIEIIRNH